MLSDTSRFPQREGKSKNHAGHRWDAGIAGIQRCSVRGDILIAVVLPKLSNAIIENLWKHAIWSVTDWGLACSSPFLPNFSLMGAVWERNENERYAKEGFHIRVMSSSRRVKGRITMKIILCIH